MSEENTGKENFSVLKTMGILSKRDLSQVLSNLKAWENQKVREEQYPTPVEIAADWLWGAVHHGDIRNRTILDAGCGNGILGIGALLLGAKKVFFVDIDTDSIKICQENYEKVRVEWAIGRAEFLHTGIELFDQPVDVVLQNPPFGTKEEHADKRFLEKAFSLAKTVYSMHKVSTKRFVEAIAKDNSFKITDVWKYAFPIKAAFFFHRKPVFSVNIGLWRMEKI